MKIVIEIDENVFTRLFDNGVEDNEIAVNDVCEMAKAIRNGTPLPKGHGDLVTKEQMIELVEFYQINPHQTKRLGRWEPNKNDDICCSICGEMALSPSFWEGDLAASKYCPNCGAKMSNAESDL